MANIHGAFEQQAPADKWFHTTSDVLQVVSFIEGSSVGTMFDQPLNTVPAQEVLERMTELTAKQRLKILTGRQIPFDLWVDYFLNIGKMAIIIMPGGFTRDGFAGMLIDKHHCYGTRSLRDWREVGVTTRIDQKLARLAHMRQLISDGQSKIDDNGETALDTVADILGYAVIGVFMATKGAHLP